MGCENQDYPPKESILRKIGKLGSNRAVTFSKGTWHHVKILETKGPLQEFYAKVRTARTQSVCAKNMRTGHFRKPLATKTVRPQRTRKDLAKNVCKLTAREAAFYFPTETWVMPVPSSEKPEEREFVVDSGASMQEPHNGCHSQW